MLVKLALTKGYYSTNHILAIADASISSNFSSILLRNVLFVKEKNDSSLLAICMTDMGF